jgi:hypothetical protein
MRQDFERRRRSVMIAQSQPAVQQQHRRQRAREQQYVIEPRMKKRQVRMRLDLPAIQDVERAAADKQRIDEIAKPSHSVQMMISPEASPIATFKASFRISSMGAIS